MGAWWGMTMLLDFSREWKVGTLELGRLA